MPRLDAIFGQDGKCDTALLNDYPQLVSGMTLANDRFWAIAERPVWEGTRTGRSELTIAVTRRLFS